MRMKCFNAESMPEAIRLVRDELGDDAVIISSQRGENGKGIRVTAAIEGFDPDPEPPAIDEPLDDAEPDHPPMRDPPLPESGPAKIAWM